MSWCTSSKLYNRLYKFRCTNIVQYNGKSLPCTYICAGFLVSTTNNKINKVSQNDYLGQFDRKVDPKSKFFNLIFNWISYIELNFPVIRTVITFMILLWYSRLNRYIVWVRYYGQQRIFLCFVQRILNNACFILSES